MRAQSPAPTAAEIAKSIRETGLDPAECYRIRDFSFTREDIRVYLSDGYVAFSKPTSGKRLWAVFTTDVEGGDGEIIVLPPTRSERQSLAGFTQSPNLDEHLRAALMIFTDGTSETLLDRVRMEAGKRAPEMGAVLADQWSPVAMNVTSAMELRLVEDVLAPRPAQTGLTFLALSGKTLGNFDVLLDERSGGRIAIRQTTERNGVPAYDVWTNFLSRSKRKPGASKTTEEFSVTGYRIEASIDPSMHVKAVSKATLQVGANPLRSLAFEIARAMQVSSVKVDGMPAELMRGDSDRGRLATRGAEDPFLVVLPEALAAGSKHEIEFEHEGDVIAAVGSDVYMVNARGSWYPHTGDGFATYDLTFRYPKRLTLVTPGELVDDHAEEDVRVTRRKTDVPIAAAGFNLGDYEKVSGMAAGIGLEVYGNRHLEEALKPKVVYMSPAFTTPVPHAGRGPAARLNTQDPVPVLPSPPDPLARLKAVSADLTSAIEFYSSVFGPMPLKSLKVAPIPGTFGQGFPGLVYLSTFAYLDPLERPAALRNAREQVFFSDLLVPHEAAHQWWGAAITINQTEDAWLLEALANYSAIVWLEKKKGPREAAKVLEGYRAELLSREGDSGPRESAGPIVWGDRLTASPIRDAWRTITYDKGAWIMHMLRKRMGDERFFAMLAALRKRYEFQTVTTENFRALAIEFRPKGLSAEAIDSFFENWVYATGIPSLKLKTSVRGAAPAAKVSGTLEQSDVDADFSADVPVEVQFARGTSQVIWVRTSSDAEPFSATVKQAPSRIAISDDILKK